MTPLRLLPAFFLLLLPPLAAGQVEQDWQAVSTVEASGRLDLSAGGWVLRASDKASLAPADDGAPPQPVRLRLASPWLRIEVDRARSDPSLVIDLEGTTRYDTWVAYEGPANVTAVAHRPGYSLFSGAHGGTVQWSAASLAAVPPRTASQQGERAASNSSRVLQDHPVNGTVNFLNPRGRMLLRGGFELSAYEVDLEVQAPNGTWTVWTGRRASPSPLPDGLAASREERQAWVFVEEGRLAIDLPGTSSSLYLRDPVAAVDGTVQLTGTERSLLERLTRRSFDGRHVLQMRSDVDNNLLARLSRPLPGQPSIPAPDPVLLPPSSFPPDSGPGPQSAAAAVPAWPWAVGAGLAALAAAAGLPARRRLLWRRLEQALDLGLYERVLLGSRHFLRRRGYARQASVLHALALLNARGADEAASFLGSLQGARRPAPGTWNYLMACAKAGQGLLEEARRHLALCLELEPAYTPEARRNPRLAGLLPDAQAQGYG